MRECVTIEISIRSASIISTTPHITTDHHRVPACRGLAVVVRGGGGEESAAPRSQCRGSRLRVSTSRAAHWATREETSHRDNISPAQPSPAQPSPAQPSPLSGLIMSDGPMSMSTRHPRCTAQALNVNQITVGGGMEWR